MSQPRRANLKDIIAGAPPVVEEASLAPVVERPRGPAPGTLKDRAHQLSLYLEPPVYDQLREIGFHERRKLHGLVLEALDMLFARRGVKSIGELTGSDEYRRQ